MIDRNLIKVISSSDSMDLRSNADSRIETPTRVRSNSRCSLCLLGRDRSKGEDYRREIFVASLGKDFNVWVLEPGLKCFRQHVAMKRRESFGGEDGLR